ncbi:MAG: RDD family protein [Bacilli bacterium]
MNNFLKRLSAFLIDMLILSLVCSMLSIFLIDNDYNNRLGLEMTETYQSYMENEIDENAFVNKIGDISYDLMRKNALYNIVSIGLYLLYFGLYQYLNNGQTIGKKVMKIKVVGKKHDLNVNDFVIRSLLINSILFNLISVIILLFLPKDVYILSNNTLIIFQYLILFICALMVIFRKDNRGLHDIICNTEVVNI